MFISFGTEYRYETLGKVADYCPHCRRVRFFEVRNTYLVQVVMLIPLGGGSLQDTHLLCCHCEGAWRFRKSKFARVFPFDKKISLAALLNETNPTLAEQLAQQESDEQPQAPDAIVELSGDSAIQWDVYEADPKQEPQLSALIESIKDYENLGDSYERLFAKLNQWRRLTSTERTELAEKVARFVECRHTEAFLIDLATTFPRYAGVMAAFLVYVPLQLIALLLLGLFWNEIERRKADDAFRFMFVGFMCPFLVGIFAYLFFSGWEKKRWFKNVLIPQAQEADIELTTLMDVLAESGSLETAEESGLAAMRRNKEILHKVLQQGDLIH